MKKPGLDDAAFAYSISMKKLDTFDSTVCFADKAWVGLSSRTAYQEASSKDSSVAVVGLCVDSRGEINTSEVAQHLVSDSLETLLVKAKRFAGSYVILCSIERVLCVIPDATATLPIFYDTEGGLAGCSEYMIANQRGYEEGGLGIAIRSATDCNQPIPYDYTAFSKIKSLLPNHYLAFETGEATRYSPYANLLGAPQLSPKEIAPEIISRGLSSLFAYAQAVDEPLTPSLTSGFDSRVNLAFCMNTSMPLECFTFWHPGFTESTPDIATPTQICKDFSLNYRYLNDEKAPTDWLEGIESLCGTWWNGGRTLDLAFTYKQAFPKGFFLAGNVFDYIAKNCLPIASAKPIVFEGDIWNSSKEAHGAVAAWIEEVESCNEKAFVHDLFNIECRLAKWASKSKMIYSYCGLVHLDIFNCQESIELLMKVPRKNRSLREIHKAVLLELEPELLQYPFNGGRTYKPRSSNVTVATLEAYIKAFAKTVLMKTRKHS